MKWEKIIWMFLLFLIIAFVLFLITKSMLESAQSTMIATAFVFSKEGVPMFLKKRRKGQLGMPLREVLIPILLVILFLAILTLIILRLFPDMDTQMARIFGSLLRGTTSFV
jgi:uncharacterized membrane protein YhdT